MKSIYENSQESRKEWMLDMFRKEGKKRSNVTTNQFWQHDNRPIELWSQDVLEQKVDYTHNNPVMAGRVLEPWHWKYSSAIDYSGGKGLIDLDL